MDKKKRENSIAAIIVLAIIAVGFFGMCIGQGMDFLREKGIIASDSVTASTPSVDWSEVYPFKPDNAAPVYDTSTADKQQAASPEKVTVLEHFRNLITKMKCLETDCEDNMPGYRKLLELTGKTNRVLGKTDFGGNNDISMLDNGHLSTTYKWNGYNCDEIDLQAQKIADFADWLEERNIRFCYMQIPTKIDKYDTNPENLKVNWNNDYYDYYIGALVENGVNVFDLRDSIHNQGIDHYSMFYKTDGHWTLEAGRWAAGEIAEIINSFGYNLDTSVLVPELYTEKTYEDWFLGTMGRKVTLGYADPDDLTIYYPTFPTVFKVVAKDKKINIQGSFEDTMFNYDVIEWLDYYENNMYEGIAWGNRPLLQVTNTNQDNDLRVLFIRDSFSLTVIPYFSLMAEQSDWIDIRTTNGNFNGGLKTYIQETNPDVVIIMHNILDYDFN